VHHPRLQQLLALPDGDTYLETVALLHGALLHGLYQAQRAAEQPPSHTTSSSSSSDDKADGAAADVAAAGSSSGAAHDDTAAGGSSAAEGQQGLGSYLATLPAGVPLPVLAGGR
jgi:hypothetical protein